MTTSQQPDADPLGETEIEDLPVPADSVQEVAGGSLQPYIPTPGQKQGNF